MSILDSFKGSSLEGFFSDEKMQAAAGNFNDLIQAKEAIFQAIRQGDQQTLDAIGNIWEKEIQPRLSQSEMDEFSNMMLVEAKKDMKLAMGLKKLLKV